MNVLNNNIAAEHRKNILKTILSFGVTTKSRLTKVLNIRPATVIPIVDSLFDEGIISINSEIQKGRSIFYQITPTGKFSIGVSISKCEVAAVLIDLQGKIYHRESSLFDLKSGPDNLFELIISTISKILSADKYNRKDCLGIGISAPGIIKDGTSTSVLAEWWQELPFRELVTDEFDLPVYVENDTICSLLAERWLGSACGVKNAVYISVDIESGVGMSILQDDKIFRGTMGGNTEFGHTTIKYDGPFCKCGNRGCLEYYLSRTWMEQRLSFHKEKGINTEIEHGGDNLLEMLIDYAGKNDKVAVTVLEELAEIFGIGMTTIVNTLNPDKVIVGGDIANCEDWFFDLTRQTMRKYAWQSYLSSMEITLSKLKGNSEIFGAAVMLFSKYFSDSFPDRLVGSS